MHTILIILCFTLFGGILANGDERGLDQILANHCFDCHGDQKSKGGLNLQQLVLTKPLIKHRDSWDHVMELVKQKEMPPEEDSVMTSDEQRLLLEFLDKELNHFDFSSIDDPGFEQTRRLSKHEYLNTIKDLFGVPQIPDLKFPDELAGASGFDNSANTLFLQTSLMSRYIAAAERVVSTLMPDTTENSKYRAVNKRMIVAFPDENKTASEAAEIVLSKFLLRAYRRPATGDEVQRYVELFDSVYQPESSDKEYVAAIKQCIQAALISPKFLYRVESDPKTTEPYRINSFELASRLSYFLWASMPDDELFDMAMQDRLHQPEILKQQIKRMVMDSKADSLGRLFAAQWLGFGLLGNRIRLDPIDNPWCTDSLMQSMRDESALFFISLVRGNHPVSDLIRAPYTFMNEELAKEIYHLNSIRGNEMRQVTLNDPARAGILTHGSLMAITSNYKETSPIKRGNWILETLLGKHLPPPPPNAGSLSEELENDDSLTFQEKVELHSKRASCKSCHSKIDPLGFSLENFDYFGRWREHYRIWKPGRENRYALMLVQSMQLMDFDEVNHRANSIDLEPEDLTWTRQYLTRLRLLSESDLKSEIYKAMTTEDQKRLIMILEEMEIEPLELDESWISLLQQGLNKIRQMSPVDFRIKLNALEWSVDDKEESLKIMRHALRLPQPDLKFRFIEKDEEAAEQLFEFIEELGLIGWEEDEEEEEGDEFDLIEITGNTSLSDGTRLKGPVGLRQVLLTRHQDDINRQLIRKMLSYALGRQLEYYDEKAVEDILVQMNHQQPTFHTLIHGIVTSYPFQFKKHTPEYQ